MTLYKHYYNITETLFTIMTGTSPIRILNAKTACECLFLIEILTFAISRKAC